VLLGLQGNVITIGTIAFSFLCGFPPLLPTKLDWVQRSFAPIVGVERHLITVFFSSLYMGSFHTVVQKMTNTGCLMVLGIFIFRNRTDQKGKKKHPLPHIASTKRKIF
jgi:hypothetical protein